MNSLSACRLNKESATRNINLKLEKRGFFKSSAQDPNTLDPQDFGFLDPDPRDKISTKNCKKKKCLLSKPKSELLKKERF